MSIRRWAVSLARSATDEKLRKLRVNGALNPDTDDSESEMEDRLIKKQKYRIRREVREMRETVETDEKTLLLIRSYQEGEALTSLVPGDEDVAVRICTTQACERLERESDDASTVLVRAGKMYQRLEGMSAATTATEAVARIKMMMDACTPREGDAV